MVLISNIYRITTVLKVETDIIASSTQDRNYCIDLYHNNVFDITLTDNFHFHSQFIDTDNIT